VALDDEGGELKDGLDVGGEIWEAEVVEIVDGLSRTSDPGRRGFETEGVDGDLREVFES
jgi:hypothetical protein